MGAGKGGVGEEGGVEVARIAAAVMCQENERMGLRGPPPVWGGVEG
jgi:hypothetical protein